MKKVPLIKPSQYLAENSRNEAQKLRLKRVKIRLLRQHNTLLQQQTAAIVEQTNVMQRMCEFYGAVNNIVSITPLDAEQ